MKRSFLTYFVMAAAVIPASAVDNNLFSVDFEPGQYLAGDLNGQQGWSTSTFDTLAFVQNYEVKNGKQAIALGSRRGLARAQMAIKLNFDNGFSASMCSRMCADQKNNVTSKNSSGLMRLEGTDIKGNAVTVDFGFMKAKPTRFADIGKSWSVFAEISVNGSIVASIHKPADAKNLANVWHNYALQVGANHVGKLYMDRKLIATFKVAATITSLDTMALQSVCASSMPCMFFDDPMVTAN